MFCVCDKSRAASTSSRMYNGAGLNSSNDKIKESATSDLRTTIVQLLQAFQMMPLKHSTLNMHPHGPI
jgi:hypothetical protein